MQLKSRIFVVFQIYVAWSPAWHFPLSSRLLWFVPSVRSGPGHFVNMTTALRVPTGLAVGGIGCAFSCWCDYKLGANKNEHRGQYDPSPKAWVEIIDNPRLIHATDDRNQ